MQRVLLSLFLLLTLGWASNAQAQCTGTFGANQFCGTGLLGGLPGPQPGFYMLPNGGAIYASPTGSDSGNSCTNSSTPCTLYGACIMRAALGTFLQSISGSLTFHVAGGTYSTSTNGVLCSLQGNSGGSSSILTNMIGSGGATLAVPDNQTGIMTKDIGEIGINGITITGGNGSIGISGGQYSVVDAESVTWGSWGTGGIHYNFSGNSTLNISGETLNNNIATHINIDSARVTAGASSVNIPGAIVFTTFINANGNSQINWNVAAVTGAGVAGSTGRRAALQGPGWLATGGTSANTVFPGNVASIINFGFQDDAVDNQTSPMAVGGTSCTLTTVSHLTVVNGVVTLCN